MTNNYKLHIFKNNLKLCLGFILFNFLRCQNVCFEGVKHHKSRKKEKWKYAILFIFRTVTKLRAPCPRSRL